MIGTKIEFQSWREHAMARTASSSESHGASTSTQVVELRKSVLEAAAWDPYEVWLTRVKQPRDARDRK